MAYRKSTEREWRRFGVPHRIVGSAWYRSSNTACVYPLPPPPHDALEATRRAKEAQYRAQGLPGQMPLTGDGENTRELTGGPVLKEFDKREPPYFHAGRSGDDLKIALAEARYFDWLDQRRITMATKKPKAKPGPQLQEILIEKGFVPNHYLLEINRTLQAKDNERAGDPWNLPSRLMQFPLEVQPGKDGLFHIGLLHPLLADHPFVQKVAAAIKPHRINQKGAANASGFTMLRQAVWWHAVDLIRTNWQDLLRTRRFTTEAEIVRAVIVGLDYPGHTGFGIEEARQVLTAVKAAPPADIYAAISLFAPPSEIKPDKASTYWPLNSNTARDRSREPYIALAWMRVWGIEAEWFGYSRSRHLGWTEKGRDLYEAAQEERPQQDAAE